MSEDHTQTYPKFDNKTLTLGTTALVTASILIPNDALRKACTASSPCVVLGIAYVFKKCKNYMYFREEQKRAENVYNKIISDLKHKLQTCTDSVEKKKIKLEIDKYEHDLNELRIKNIKAFV